MAVARDECGDGGEADEAAQQHAAFRLLRVEQRGKAEAHLHRHHFTRAADGREHELHAEAERQPDHHLQQRDPQPLVGTHRYACRHRQHGRKRHRNDHAQGDLDRSGHLRVGKRGGNGDERQHAHQRPPVHGDPAVELRGGELDHR